VERRTGKDARLRAGVQAGGFAGAGWNVDLDVSLGINRDAFFVDNFADTVLIVNINAAAGVGALVTGTAAFFACVFFACGEVVVARDLVIIIRI
jgi:hypothetical protein